MGHSTACLAPVPAEAREQPRAKSKVCTSLRKLCLHPGCRHPQKDQPRVAAVLLLLDVSGGSRVDTGRAIGQLFGCYNCSERGGRMALRAAQAGGERAKERILQSLQKLQAGQTDCLRVWTYWELR